MKKFIQKLSATAEICLVLLIGFGMIIAAEAGATALRRVLVINDGFLLRILVQELLALGDILWIGRIRGWSLSTFGWKIFWKGTAAGILLFITVTIAKILVLMSLSAIHPKRPGLIITGLTVPLIILFTMINPFFEELLEAGYFIGSLRRFGMWPVIIASSSFRGILHLYQGINGAAAIFVGGVFIDLLLAMATTLAAGHCTFARRFSWPVIFAPGGLVR